MLSVFAHWALCTLQTLRLVRLHPAVHTAHCVLVHCRLPTHCTPCTWCPLYTAHCILCRPHIVCPAHSKVCTLHPELLQNMHPALLQSVHGEHCKVCALRPLHTTHCTFLYVAHCTLHALHFTHSVLCALHTLHSAHSALSTPQNRLCAPNIAHFACCALCIPPTMRPGHSYRVHTPLWEQYRTIQL